MARDTVDRIVTLAGNVISAQENRDTVREWIMTGSTAELQEFISKVGHLSQFWQLASQVLHAHYSEASLQSAQSCFEQTRQLTELLYTDFMSSSVHLSMSKPALLQAKE